MGEAGLSGVGGEGVQQVTGEGGWDGGGLYQQVVKGENY